jgi:hypothetical protein
MMPRIHKSISTTLRTKPGVRGDTLEFLILGAMWIIVFAASIVDLGRLPAIAFLVLCSGVVLWRPRAVIYVWLLLFYTPADALEIPRLLVVCTAIAVLSIVIHAKRLHFPKAIDPFFLLAVMLIGVMTISTITASHPSNAFDRYVKYAHSLVSLFLFRTLVTNEHQLTRIFKWWAMVAAFTMAISASHFFLGPETHLNRVVVDNLDAGKEVPEQEVRIHEHQTELTKRFIWIGLPANGFSATLIFPLGIALGLFSVATPGKRAAWLLAIALIIAAILATYSKTGFLLAAGMVVAYVLVTKTRNLGWGIVILVPLAGAMLLFPDLLDQVVQIPTFAAEGASGRYRLWGIAFQLWLEHPFLGIGLSEYLRNTGLVVHNSYLQFLTELGVVGLTIFVLGIVYVLSRSLGPLRLNQSHGRGSTTLLLPIVIGFCAVCTNLMTITLTDFNLFWLQGAAVLALCNACNDPALAEFGLPRRAQLGLSV